MRMVFQILIDIDVKLPRPPIKIHFILSNRKKGTKYQQRSSKYPNFLIVTNRPPATQAPKQQQLTLEIIKHIWTSLTTQLHLQTKSINEQLNIGVKLARRSYHEKQRFSWKQIFIVSPVRKN